MAGLVRCVVSNPSVPATLDPKWRTADVRGLAVAAYEDRAFDRLPILADAGSDDQAVLGHCRAGGLRNRGCWVVDLVLSKE